MESVVEVIRLEGVDDEAWASFIRCLSWRVQVDRDGEPPEDWGPDPAERVIELPIPTTFHRAVEVVEETAGACADNWPQIATIGS